MGRTHPILLFCKTVLPSVGRKMRLAALKATIHLAAKVLCFAGTLAGLKRVSIICSLLNFPVGTTGYLASEYIQCEFFVYMGAIYNARVFPS